jgi:hypothetical protein
MGVAVSAQDPRMIAVSTVDRGNPVDTVWLSRDGGAHWDELWRRSVRDVSSTPFLDFNGKANFGHWIAGLAIDPFDPGHAAYVTGATVYGTQALDKPGEMAWQPWTQGIEQTAVITLTSPTGGAHLISGFGDIGGFRHDDLAVSPPRMHLQPFLTNTNTLDYAGLTPAIMVRSGNTHTLKVPDTSLAWSADGGASWSAASAALRASCRWLALPGGDRRCRDHRLRRWRGLCGRDRQAAAFARSWRELGRDLGAPSRIRVTADKVDARHFYALDFARAAFCAATMAAPASMPWRAGACRRI